jgi:hypothetical protein
VYALFVAVVTGMVLGGEVFAQGQIKCGTQERLELLLRHKKGKLPQGYPLPPILTDSIVSPSGKFRIHFNKTGDSAATTDYVNAVAQIADDASSFEIAELGYPKPAYSFGDSLWHIYIMDLPSNIYGYTSPLDSGFLGFSPSGLDKYRSYIVIDNDFSLTPTKGLDAARITVFHEFHHMIQFSDYGERTEDVNFREMTSVWMEVRSNPDIKDYLQYISTYFADIEKQFDKVGNYGYNQAVWMQFLQLRYGDDVIKNIWEDYSAKSGDPLTSFDTVLHKKNSSFCSDYKRFGAEIFFTGRRFRGASIFPDAKLFPVDALKYNKLAPGVPMTDDIVDPASLQLNAAGVGADTSVVSISRSTDRRFVSADTVTITDLATYRAGYQFPETFCDTIVGSKATDAIVFPEPYLIIENANRDPLHIRAKDREPSSDTRLTIYTTSFSLIRHIEAPASPVLGGYYMDWDGTDDHGKTVSSGVYLYNIEVDGEKRAGKFVVVRKQ